MLLSESRHFLTSYWCYTHDCHISPASLLQKEKCNYFTHEVLHVCCWERIERPRRARRSKIDWCSCSRGGVLLYALKCTCTDSRLPFSTGVIVIIVLMTLYIGQRETENTIGNVDASIEVEQPVLGRRPNEDVRIFRCSAASSQSSRLTIPTISLYYLELE